MPRLLVIIGSTRPVRVGEPVAAWFTDRARAHGGFEVDVADLRALDLPLMDEAKHPRFGEYQLEHTLAWADTVRAADAVVFVMPEYNHSFTAPVKNAIDYLLAEWSRKPVGFVSYGGVSAGLRAVQALKPVCLAVGMVPATPAVNIPWIARHVEGGVFTPFEQLEGSANAMLDELVALAGALRSLR